MSNDVCKSVDIQVIFQNIFISLVLVLDIVCLCKMERFHWRYGIVILLYFFSRFHLKKCLGGRLVLIPVLHAPVPPPPGATPPNSIPHPFL
jgi:hypothetical protein